MLPQRDQLSDQVVIGGNMTPLIDVSLVLVVILLLLSPLALENGFAVQSAVEVPAATVPQQAIPPVELAIESETAVRLAGQVVSPDAVAPLLAGLLAAGGVPVVIRCSAEVSHGAFVQVVDQAVQAGAASVAVERM